MKISNWQDIIISWANALRLLDEPVSDVLDLVKGSFFVKLLNQIKNVDQDGVSYFSDDVYNVIENFLKDEFSGFRLLGYWDENEVTLVSSVMLLWSSLESQACRTPLYKLDDSVQIKIQAFIQRFIQTPQHLINRQLVMDAVLDITFDLDSEDESLSFSSSPSTYSTPKRPSTSSSIYSPAFMALSEVRSLRRKLDLLHCEKQHLQEELDLTKTQLSEKRMAYALPTISERSEKSSLDGPNFSLYLESTRRASPTNRISHENGRQYFQSPSMMKSNERQLLSAPTSPIGVVDAVDPLRSQSITDLSPTGLRKRRKNKLQQKEVELVRLKNLVACEITDSGLKLMNEQKSESCSDFSKNSSVESSLVKMELEELKDMLNKLREDLETTMEENTTLSQELTHERKRRIESDERCDQVVTNNITLSQQVEDLEKVIASLKKTCEEQRLILAERTEPLDDDSMKYTECETLEGVVDIKYSEIKEELKAQTVLLEEKTNEVKELIKSKEIAESTIGILKKEIDRLKVEYTDSKNVTVNCLECEILRQKITSCQLNYTSKEKECEKLKHEFVQNAVELKSLMNYKSSYENKMANLQKEYVECINDYNIQIDSLKEEILSHQCELGEKDRIVTFYKDETDFLNSCLVSKTADLNKLECDYAEVCRSKDREISHLMRTIEHLNKEVRVVREGERDKPNRSASDWRQWLVEGSGTANEEIAQELIALNESLQWKTVKIGELSLQLDQLRSEVSEKEALNKELHERLVHLSDKNRDLSKELHTNNNATLQLQSKLANLEFSERRLTLQLVQNNKQYQLVDYELNQLWKLLKQKFHTIDLEMDSCMLRGKTDLQDIVKFIDFMSEKLKENRKSISHLSIAINELEADNAEKTAELEMVECRLEKLSSVNGSKVIQRWVNDNTDFHERLKKIETDYENKIIKLQDTLSKLENANECIKAKDEVITGLQLQVDELSQDLKVKVQLVECLQQNMNLYEHEKSILKKKLHNLSDISPDNLNSPQQQQLARADGDLGQLEDSTDFTCEEEKSTQSFHDKLLDLQAKMRMEYEHDIQKISEEHGRKIQQLKAKVKKDCAHIEHLSSELWETSDRLLLAQQEAEALRSQLRKTRSFLREQADRGTEDSSSFMWLGGGGDGEYVEEFVATVCGRRKADAGGEDQGVDEEDAMFNQEFLEDLKAGICRLPSPIGRLSCPAQPTHLEDDRSTFLQPSGRPRKLKGSIMYRKPGPPTPSISAARLSLPGLELRRGLREQNTNSSSGRSRLSQLFGSMSLSKSTKTLQDSPTPKVKRKGFFQRTFRNRENLPPKG